MTSFMDLYVKCTYPLNYMITHIWSKPFYYIFRPILYWLMRQKLLDIIFHIDSIEELIYEFIMFMDNAHRIPVNQLTGISKFYDDPNRPNQFIYTIKKDALVDNNTVIICQLSSRDNHMCIRIDLNINTSPCLTNLVCSFGEGTNTYMRVDTPSVLMKYKKDIIELLKEEIIDHVWYVYTEIIDQVMFKKPNKNSTGE